MPNVDAITFRWGDSDFLALEYNDANLRARRVHVSLSAGRSVRVLVWDTDDGGDPSDPATAFVDHTFTGPVVDEISVPGSFQLIERVDAAGAYHDVSDNIIYRFEERVTRG